VRARPSFALSLKGERGERPDSVGRKGEKVYNICPLIPQRNGGKERKGKGGGSTPASSGPVLEKKGGVKE